MESYFVIDFFENSKDKKVVVLGKFDYNDAPKKNLLLKVIEDPSKDLRERSLAAREYDLLMGKGKGYYVSKGVFFPGGILRKIPEDAELVPDFEERSWESCFGRLESDRILEKVGKLKSGVYHYFDGQSKDMVYGVSEACFLNWINKHTDLDITGMTSQPISVKDRYNILTVAEENGFVFGRIGNEWDEFEQKMKKHRGLIRKV